MNDLIDRIMIDARKYSQTELSAMSGVSQATICRLLNSKNKGFYGNLDNFIKIANALGYGVKEKIIWELGK